MNKLIFILILLITFPVLGGSWIRSSNGKIPLNTIKSGWEANNDSLYLCAVSYKVEFILERLGLNLKHVTLHIMEKS